MPRRKALAELLKVSVEELDGVMERHKANFTERNFEVLCAYFSPDAESSKTTKLAQRFDVTRERIDQLRDKAVEVLWQRLDEERVPKDPLEIPIHLFFSAARAQRAEAKVQPERIYACLMNAYGKNEEGKLTTPPMKWFLEEVTELKLLEIPNFGRKSVVAIRMMLATEGFSLKYC